jgi:hypothetical protein
MLGQNWSNLSFLIELPVGLHQLWTGRVQNKRRQHHPKNVNGSFSVPGPAIIDIWTRMAVGFARHVLRWYHDMAWFWRLIIPAQTQDESYQHSGTEYRVLVIPSSILYDRP